MTEALRPLKQAFLDEYGHFADQRFKKIDSSDLFVVDDRESEKSFGANGEPFGWFCPMLAKVDSPDAIMLAISGPLPMSADVEACIKRVSVRTHIGRRMLRITPANVDELLSLRAALLSIVAKGKRYDTPSHKYVCPRMAACLKRLHGVLVNYWG